jgi:Family of unknown function (DUF6526)
MTTSLLIPAAKPDAPTQSYRSHRRFNPLVHGFLSPVLVGNALVAIVRLVRAPSWPATWATVMAVALPVLNWAARSQALRVQDRVIRLEMRLRLAAVLPPALAARVHALTLRQLLALRFASDAELPSLVERCLAGELTEPDAIKREIRDWQPDVLRA